MQDFLNLIIIMKKKSMILLLFMIVIYVQGVVTRISFSDVLHVDWL